MSVAPSFRHFQRRRCDLQGASLACRTRDQTSLYQGFCVDRSIRQRDIVHTLAAKIIKSFLMLFSFVKEAKWSVIICVNHRGVIRLKNLSLLVCLSCRLRTNRLSRSVCAIGRNVAGQNNVTNGISFSFGNYYFLKFWILAELSGGR